MSERYDSDDIMYQKKQVSNRTLLMNIDEPNIQDPEERSFVQQYKQIYQQLEATGEFRYEQKLRNLEGKEIFKSLVDREREKLRIQREINGRLALDRMREKEAIEWQETIERIRKKREEDLRREFIQSEPREIQSKPPIKEKTKAEEGKKSKVKSIFTSIPLSILGLLEVYLIYLIICLVIALVFWIISCIPILSTLTEWLFRIRKDAPDMFAMLLGTTIAYFGYKTTIEHITKSMKTRRLTFLLTGAYLIVINVISLIGNLMFNNAILANILLGVAGIVIFYKGKTTKKEE